MSCCESITNGAVPVATTVGPDLTLSNLYVGNVFSNFISVSNISIPGSDAIPGYVLGTTGTSVEWVAQSGGSGGSQWVGTAGNPIYYTKPVGIGSAATPTATLMVTGNIYASNAVQTPRLLATTANIGTLNVTGAVTFSNVSGNGAGLSSFNASNLTFGIVNSSLIYGNTLSNINASNLAFGIVNSSLIYGNTLSNINASNLAFGIVNSSLIYGNTLSNIQSSNITQPFANLVVSNTVTTTNLSVTGAITSNSTNTTIFFDTLTIPYINTLTMNSAAVTTGTLTATGATSFANIIVSNLQVTNSFIITATNVQSTNALSITNQGTQTALYVRQNEPTLHTYNVAEFWDNIQLAMVVDPRGNVAIHTVSSPGYAFTVVDGAKIDNLTVTGSLVASGAALSSLNASNITTGIISSSRIYGNTLSNIQSSNITQPFANLAVSNSVTAANITASRGMGVGTYAGSAAPTNSLIVSGNLGLGKNNPGYQLDMTGSAVIGGNLVIQTGGAMANPLEVRGSAAIGSYAGVDAAPSNGLIVSGNTGIGTNSPGYLLDVAGYMRSVAIVDHTSSIGSAGQVLTSTGSTLEWAPPAGFTQPLANLVVSNTVTTSEIICNAFTTSTSTNWNYVSNAASARSTSVGWQGIRQVFGDHITATVYVYYNAVLETTLSYIAPGFGSFVAVGGLFDEIIVVSGVDAFYVYNSDGPGTMFGPTIVDTTPDLGVNNTLWMPSLSAENSLTVTLVIGGYGYGSAAPGVGNPGVGVYNIRHSDGSTGFVGEITPYNSVGSIYRNTVAISGDGTTIAIGQQDSSILYVYSIGDFLTPVFSDSSTGYGDEYFVSIDYYGQIVLLTINGSVRMYSISLSPV